MRWKEVTLTVYEMQWTLRYFSYMSWKWILPQNISSPDICGSLDSGTGTGPGYGIHLTKGAIAYWNRKKEIWTNLMKKADYIFRHTHPAYESPHWMPYPGSIYPEAPKISLCWVGTLPPSTKRNCLCKFIETLCWGWNQTCWEAASWHATMMWSPD